MVRLPTLDEQYEDAAELVARGLDLDTAAAETDTDFDALKAYTKAHPREWAGFIRAERRRLLGQAGAEALNKLRVLIRSPDQKAQLTAAMALLKFWMTTIRHGGKRSAGGRPAGDVRLARGEPRL